uniref:Uncharacterized protein n=1 Tax=Globodera rostochiensis TaxID=31243 RepID=A0A914H4V4_GLORO
MVPKKGAEIGKYFHIKRIQPSTSGGTSGGASSSYKQSGSTNEGTKLQKRILEPHGGAPSYKQFDSKKLLVWIPEGYR